MQLIIGSHMSFLFLLISIFKLKLKLIPLKDLIQLQGIILHGLDEKQNVIQNQ